MGTLPLLVQYPVRTEGGALHLVIPGQLPIRLQSGTVPVERFNEGWHAELLFTLLDPLWILVLRHQDDSVAIWHVTNEGMLAAAPHHCPEAERKRSAERLQHVVRWLEALHGAAIQIAVPDAVRAYASLPALVRHELDLLLTEPVAASLLDLDMLAALDRPAPTLVFQRIGDSQRYLVGNPGRLVPLSAGELQPGWRIDRIHTVFAPLLTVILRHEQGARAVWFIDLNGQLVSNHVSLLPVAFKQHLAEAVAPLIDNLWRRLALGEQDVPTVSLDGIEDLSAGDLGELVPLHLKRLGQGGETRTWLLEQALPAGLGYIIPTRHGLRVYEQATVLPAVMHGLHSEMDRLLRDGRMCWPSPADGSMIESDGFALLLTQNCFAYRFCDQAAGLVFYVVCTGTHFYNYALYFPTADLLVARDGGLAAACRPIFAYGKDAILRHLMIHRRQLAQGGGIPRDETIQQYFGACGIHIGHYVWQDMSGLAYMLRHIASDRQLPHLHMFSMRATSRFFGPEARIFPQFEGRITHHEEPFAAHVGTFYRLNQRVIQYTAISVPAELRPLVRAAGDATPELRAVCAAADAATALAAPVILIGIRVGNRTLQDMEDFAVELLGRLGLNFPGCTVILDGLNDPNDAGDTNWQDEGSGSDLDNEFRIGRRLEALSERHGIHFVNNINRSALRSVVWCSRADCFLAPLGAALAKYRWICNTPGLVVTSRWNLEHRTDLHIYDTPAALEGSSEMQFCSIDHVHDLDPEADAGGHDGRGNFTVDRDAIFAQFEELVRRQLAGRLAAQMVLKLEEPPGSNGWAPEAAMP